MQAVEHASPLTAAVRRALAAAMPIEGPDEELLHRFIQTRDEYAFHALVRRHGGMVLSVCRYVLRNDADADDAFQATFLLLAAKANNVRNPAALSGWLYEVAGRTAGKALTSRNRRRTREASAPRPVQAYHPDFETLAIVHEELRALPERYRIPLVLHHLDGRTQDDTANILGISKSGVKKRLDQAREALRNRLTRRGLAPTAVLVAPAALVGKEFATHTSAMAVGYAAGALPAGALSAAVLALVQQGAPIMYLMKIAACGLLLVGGTLGLATMGGKPDEKQERKLPAVAKVEAKADKKEWKLKTTLELDGWLPSSVAYSSDGKLLAVGASEGKLFMHETPGYKKLWEADHGKNKLAVAFSPYSEMVAVTKADGALLLNALDGKQVPESGKVLAEKGDAPEAIAFMPDKPLEELEKGLVNRRLVLGNAYGTMVVSWMKWPLVSTITVNAVAKDKQPADPFAYPLAVDPAGRCVVMTGPIDPKTGKNVLWAHVAGDYSKGSPGNRIMEGHTEPVLCAAWSADGKTVATGDTDGTVILWDGATLKEKGKVGFDRRVCALAINADGSRIAAAVIANDQVQGEGVGNYHELVYVWDPKEKPDRSGYLKSPDDKPQLQPFAGTASLAFSHDGKQLASAFFNQASLLGPKKPLGKIRIWELNKPKEENTEWRERAVLESPGQQIPSLSWRPDGKALALGGTKGKLAVYDAVGFAKKWEHDVKGFHSAVAYTPDSKHLATTYAHGVRLLEAESGASGEEVVEDGSRPDSVAFFPDLVAEKGGGKVGVRRMIFGTGYYRLHSWASGPDVVPVRIPLPGGTMARTEAEIERDRQQRQEQTGNDTFTGKPLALDPRSAAVVMNGRINPNTGIPFLQGYTFDGDGRKITSERIMVGHVARVLCAAWSADGRTIATGDEAGIVIFWDALKVEERKRIEFNRPVLALALSADGSKAAAAVFARLPTAERQFPSYHERFYVWNTTAEPDHAKPLPQADDKPILGKFHGEASISFSPDGKLLAGSFASMTGIVPKGGWVGKAHVWEMVEDSKGSKELEGEWKAVGMEEAGRTLPKNEFEGLRFTFKDGKLDVSDYSRPGNKPRELMLLRDSKYVADAEVQPRTLDLQMVDMHRGVTIKGIYRIRDGELKIALRTLASWELPRPSGYSTISSKLVSVTLEKVKPGEESAERKAVDLKLKQVFVVKDNLSVRPSAVSPNGPVIHFFKGLANEVKVSPGETVLVEMPKRSKVVSWVIPGYDPEGLGDDEGPEFDYVLCKWERNGQVTFTAMRKP